MGLSLRTWITFFALSLLMGLNNVYSTLLTGWGDGGSIVAVILCLLFLPAVTPRILTYNLGQTIASAGGSVGFTVAILASIYYWYAKNGTPWQPPLVSLSLLVLAVSAIGVAVAIPMRRYVVQWFFPSAVACATILKTVTSENAAERSRSAGIMGYAGMVSAILTLPTKISLKAGEGAIWHGMKLPAGLSLSFDPLLYGIGVVVGHRIGTSMLIGGLFTTLVLIPHLVPAGENPGDYVRWSAVGLMTLPAFASMVFAFVFKTKRELPPGFTPRESDEPLSSRMWGLVGGVFVVSLGVAIWAMQSIFGVGAGYVIAGVLMGGPLVVALGKVASETDINPVRLLAIILLFVFSAFGTHTAPALLAMGICGAALASIAVDLFYDLRTGHLVGADPQRQMILQFLGVIPASFVCVWFLHLLATNYGIGEGTQFPAPGAVVWATMGDAFSKGASSLSTGVWVAVGITSAFGVLLSLLEQIKATRDWTPSSFALGIALLLPFEMSAAIFLGSMVRYGLVVHARLTGGPEAERQVTNDAFQGGSAVFAAAALTGIVAVILITLGVVHLPAGH